VVTSGRRERVRCLGPCKQGWDELGRTFRWVATRFGGGDLRCEDVIVNVSGDLAYTVGYERGTMVVDGGDPQPMTIRVTHIYRKEDGYLPQGRRRMAPGSPPWRLRAHR
jgi:ketosteroid isomerase-like protein